MASCHPPTSQTASDATDVFSISDSVLSEKLQFVEEIGSGNWGSVWLCCTKAEAGEDNGLARDSAPGTSAKLAVKLVHRAKSTPKTDEEKSHADVASKRVKTLWSEMKIVRTLNQEPHPSIINFQSFIITPSFAMIAMPFLPQLIPVEVPERHAKPWLFSLLSGIDFIHSRGVVHNDIKPANVMISSRNVPVLIDFGFAEHYEPGTPEAFISNLHYGTPEYIAPERAGGLSHDTRRADIWSLGVTFFEILVGRTPFESGEHEQFITTEDLKIYWRRTLKGEWFGDWKMSAGAERLIGRMLNPNPDARYSAAEALADKYWSTTESQDSAASSLMVPSAELNVPSWRGQSVPKTPSITDILSPWSSRSTRSNASSRKENLVSVAPKPKEKRLVTVASSPRLDSAEKCRTKSALTQSNHSPVLSPKTRSTSEIFLVPTPARSRPVAPEVFVSSPLEHSSSEESFSPPPRPRVTKRQSPKSATSSGRKVRQKPTTRNPLTPSKTVGKENASSRRRAPKPIGPRMRGTPSHEALKASDSSDSVDSSVPSKRILKDRTAAARSAANVPHADSEHDSDGSVHLSGTLNRNVARRMTDWERERSRMRAMLDSDASPCTSPMSKEKTYAAPPSPSLSKFAQRVEAPPVFELRKSIVLPVHAPVVEMRLPQSTIHPTSEAVKSVLGKRNTCDSVDEPEQRMSQSIDGQSRRDSTIELLRQSLKFSAGFAQQAVEHVAKRSTSVMATLERPRHSLTHAASWGEEVISESEARPSLTKEDREIRMSDWFRSVEKAVEDCRQNFGQLKDPRTAPVQLPLPPKPRRSSRARAPSSSRKSRTPRKSLPAHQIFGSDASPSASLNASTYDRTVSTTMETSMSSTTMLATPNKKDALAAVAIVFSANSTPSPTRPRRNTVASHSPKPSIASRRSRKKKADENTGMSPKKERSKSNRQLQMTIRPVSELNMALDRSPEKPQRPNRLSALVDKNAFLASLSNPPTTPEIRITRDDDSDLTSSPFIVEPYPTRNTKPYDELDTPDRLRTESAYDQFLLASSGVKRVGQGYQSSTLPVGNFRHPSQPKRSSRFFASSRKSNLPPPVASENMTRSSSIDELGVLLDGARISPPDNDDTTGVWRALKAVVIGKTTSRRLSRVII